MSASRIRGVVLFTGMAAFAAVGSGCYADAEYPEGYQGEPEQAAPQPRMEPAQEYAYAQEAQPQVVVEGYQPQYYDGYVVYYDTVGRPFYYTGGVPYYVPYTYPYYGNYVSHYRSYAPAYRRWYAGYGHRYTHYRVGGSYGGSYGGYHGYRGYSVGRGGGHSYSRPAFHGGGHHR